jgi:hypothetical protein
MPVLFLVPKLMPQLKFEVVVQLDLCQSLYLWMSTPIRPRLKGEER